MSSRSISPTMLVIVLIMGSMVMSVALYSMNFLDSKKKERFVITEKSISQENKDFYKALQDRYLQIIANDLQKYNYLGEYKLSERDLILTGYYSLSDLYCDNNWHGTWLGKYGIRSKKDLIFAPLIQELIVSSLFSIYNQDIYYYGLDKYIDNVNISITSLVAVMYLYNLYDVLNFFYDRSVTNVFIEQDLKRFFKFDIAVETPKDYGIIDSVLHLFREIKCYG